MLCTHCCRKGMFWPMIPGKFVLVSSMLWLKASSSQTRSCLSNFFAWLCYQWSLKQRMATFSLPFPICCFFAIMNSHREGWNFSVSAKLEGEDVLHLLILSVELGFAHLGCFSVFEKLLLSLVWPINFISIHGKSSGCPFDMGGDVCGESMQFFLLGSLLKSHVLSVFCQM